MCERTPTSLKLLLPFSFEHTKSVTTLDMLHCSQSLGFTKFRSVVCATQLHPKETSPHKDTCLLWCAWLNLLPTSAPDGVEGGLVVIAKHHPSKKAPENIIYSKLDRRNPWI